MFETGLRIGEVLGLTFEDVVSEKFEDNYYPVVYIRNRLTDKPYQRAKTCMNITNTKQYKSKDYQVKNYGYQLVIISEELMDLIDIYIEEHHARSRRLHPKSYQAHVKADQVAIVGRYNEDNYYIFINNLAKPISSHLWNITLRKIFKDTGLVVNQKVRKDNLNHRFRHGFAMYHVQYFGLDSLQLKELLRHRSIESVAHYYNPTLEDAIKIKNDFVRDLYSLIPELNIQGGN